MTPTDSTLASKKLEKKAEIEAKYLKANESSLTKLGIAAEMIDTSTLAKYFDTAKLSPEGLIIKNVTVGPIIYLTLIHITQILLLIFFGKDFGAFAAFIVIEILLAIGAVFFWAILLNRDPKIIIDSSSLNIISKNLEIEWDNLITTHIRRTYGKNATNFLVINFYDPYTDDFIEKRINLAYLKTTELALSAAIEYYKKLCIK